MNRSKTLNLSFGFLLAGCLLAAPLLPADAEDQAAEKDKPVQSAVAQKPAQSSQEPAAETTSPAVQTPPANVSPMKDFKPTEKIGADSAVAFPIDI